MIAAVNARRSLDDDEHCLACVTETLKAVMAPIKHLGIAFMTRLCAHNVVAALELQPPGAQLEISHTWLIMLHVEMTFLCSVVSRTRWRS